MSLEIVATRDARQAIKVTRVAPVPLTEEERQILDKPARNLVTCSDCNLQIDRSTAARSDEGFICAKHIED